MWSHLLEPSPQLHPTPQAIPVLHSISSISRPPLPLPPQKERDSEAIINDMRPFVIIHSVLFV